jgi:hypothetical protein
MCEINIAIYAMIDPDIAIKRCILKGVRTLV